MIKTRTVNWPVLAAALLCFAACGKKDDAAPTPVLSAPGSIEKVPAQAEVKASSGPVELSFLLHKTKIKVGESLWQQIRVRNVGDKELVVADQVFRDPRQLRDNSNSGYGIFIEVRGPDGSPLKVKFRSSVEPQSHIAEEISGLLEVEGPEEQAMLNDWKKKGLTDQEIGMKLIDFNTKKKQAAEIHQQNPVIKLQPGQSAETKSWSFYSMQDQIHKRPTPRPVGDFAQLDFFELSQPGQYKVRAVYDQAPTEKSAELSRQLGLSTYPEEVQFRTPWIQVLVLP